MIRDQCSAYCQCAYCAGQSTRGDSANVNSLRITKEDAAAAGTTKDALYAQSLKDSIRTRAMLSSSRNASKFIPDEQLVSSAKRREAKETAIASETVPVRRRDRLEELLVLEHKARLREEARLRAERRAQGLPEEEGQYDGAQVASVPTAEPTPAQTPSAHASSQQDSRLSTPSSRCSADRDLQNALREIKGIVDQDPATDAQQPLSREQIYKLRQLVHGQNKKARAQVESCGEQPHICNHCLSVNVQARHLVQQPGGSVAFAQTGKVINPEEGVKFGTDTQRGLDGTYSMSNNDQRMLSGKGRVSNYNPHPYGSGMVFLPLQTGNASGTQGSMKSMPFAPTFNNNISAAEPVEAAMQYPGSTYNVYDDRARCPTPPAAAAAIDNSKSNSTSQNSLAGGAASGKVAAGRLGGSGSLKTSSSMWRTTNQARAADMERFVEFQKTMSANSKRVYDSTATRAA